MNPAQIQASVDYLKSRAETKGMISCDVNLYFRSDMPPRLRIDGWMGEMTTERWQSKVFDAERNTSEAIDVAIDQCHSWIDELKTPEELDRQAAVAKLGELIDFAKKIDLDIEFLNPLTETMKKLSENVIEHHK